MLAFKLLPSTAAARLSTTLDISDRSRSPVEPISARRRCKVLMNFPDARFSIVALSSA